MDEQFNKCPQCKGTGGNAMIEPKNLIVGERYQTLGGNIYCLQVPYDPNTECFRRESDNGLHFGREFIEFCEDQTMINLCDLSAPEETR